MQPYNYSDILAESETDADFSFYFQQIDVAESRMDEVYRLRYRVYCLERGFETPEEHPAGIERDVYDFCSSHFCAVSTTSGRVVGTVRIINHSLLGFPIERHCELYPHYGLRDLSRVGEISRLAISKELLRLEMRENSSAAAPCPRQRDMRTQVVRGLYQCVYQYCIEEGLTHVYAVMAEGLWNLLQRWHICWNPIGPEIDYHGCRTPYMAEIAASKARIRECSPWLLERPLGWRSQSSQGVARCSCSG